ncbi:MAG: CHAT domain-containing protein, partial [Saprospiraceae bacterium]|nr:CHAT domain-containing protein [Saprospiraceae bacterium]
MTRPVIYLAFANDRDQYLQMINQERKQISRALQAHTKEGRIQLVTEASSTIEDIFQEFHTHDHEVAIFHYGGHATGTHLVLEAADGSSASAQSTGLASLLGSQKQLKLVFLNGCATKAQVEELINKGVRAVIATSVKIDDSMATEFAEQFYKALANHSTIRESFDRASAFIKSKYASAQIGTFGGSQLVEWMARPSDELAWGLYVRNPADDVLDWS